MIKALFPLTVFAICTIASCKSTKPGSAAAEPVSDILSDYSSRKITKDKELYAATKEIVPLDTAYLTRDTLHILTKKIVGCDADNFKLMWNGAIQKSMPPQTNVKLFQQVDPECKEQHRFHLTYNVKSLRLKNDYASVCLDSCAAQSVRLRIGGYKDHILYEFGH
jgi:hypothetical protein